MDFTNVLLSLILVIAIMQVLIAMFRKPSDHSQHLLAVVTTIKDQQTVISGDMKQEIANQRREMTEQLRESRQDLDNRLVKFNQHQLEIFEMLNREVKDLVNTNESRFNRLHDETSHSLEKIRLQMGERLDLMRVDNSTQLEKMRATVDEKLHQTL